jgi:DNA-3-methyladenine glycosylase
VKLRRAFFARPTVDVARDLLGLRLQRRLDGASPITGRIVEVEAYPPGDPASHAYRGPTRRCASMFGLPGTAYVYFIYGMHWCVNVVTEAEGVGAAVLIRGLDQVPRCAGPSRLCRALGIDRNLDGVDLLDPRSPLRLLPAQAAVAEPVRSSARINVTRAIDRRWRFYLEGSDGVSAAPRPAARRG